MDKSEVAKRKDDLIEAISVHSQIDWRTAEAITDEVRHLENMLSGDISIKSIAVVVTQQALERHYGGPPFFEVDEILTTTGDSPDTGESDQH